MTEEYPTLIALRMGKMKNGGLEISSIHFEGEVPEESDPRTYIVLPKLSVQARDAALGQMMAAWGRIEDCIRNLIGDVGEPSGDLVTRSAKANTLFATRLQKVDTQIEHVEKHQPKWFSKEECDGISGWLREYKEISLLRNKIVHGQWSCEVVFGSSEEGFPEIQSLSWERVYSKPNKPSFRFSIQEIAVLRERIDAHQGRFRNLAHRGSVAAS
ncbi:hypothetical protein GOB15_18735 [Sinorhizobium meliloti]|nr:hypothetical protein [Sinorhizobium meliloti]MDW9513252.1 hypothetical protein [Sinorhizobium meliloti]